MQFDHDRTKSHVVHLEREKQALSHRLNANISPQNANLLSTYILNRLIKQKILIIKTSWLFS